MKRTFWIILALLASMVIAGQIGQSRTNANDRRICHIVQQNRILDPYGRGC